MTLKLKEDVGFSKTNGVGTLVLRRAPLNILDIAFMRELDLFISDPANLEDLSVLAIKAEGKAFCAGVDVADHTVERTEEMIQVFHRLIARLQKLSVPTVALVEGAALGGGFELALACDMIVASERAKFGVPEITLAVFPPVAMVILPGLIGMKKACDLILSGKTITAAEAERLGLVNDVYETDQFPAKSGQFLERFVKLSRTSLQLSKQTLMESARYINQAEALKCVEEVYLNTLMKTADAQEGIAAFMEKREPVWSHNPVKRHS